MHRIAKLTTGATTIGMLFGTGALLQMMALTVRARRRWPQRRLPGF